MNLPRAVDVEVLDGLVVTDPAAQRSRRDLRRVQRIMGTRSIILGALRHVSPPRAKVRSFRVLELGAGDGDVMIGVARTLGPHWPLVELTLLDRLALVDEETLARYATVGWVAESRVMDVLDWSAAQLRDGAVERWDLILVNLFLHHFEGAHLAALLDAIAGSTDRFIACEPRRSRVALAGSYLVGAIGANAVTRRDAVSSVHAGFRGSEITALWPAQGSEWRLREYDAGPFSHCFLATREAAN
jgi:hypothetical protein